MASNASIVKQALATLPQPDQRKYRLAVLLQMATSVLDLAGVLLFGVVGLLAAVAAQDQPVPAQVEQGLEVIGLGSLTVQQSALILAAIAAALLIGKGLVTLLINRRVIRFLARCTAETSARFSREFFSMPLVRIQQETSQSVSYSLTFAVTAMVMDVLSNAMIIRTEVALLALLGAALLVLDPVTTLLVIGYLGLVVLLMTKGLARWTGRSGDVVAATEVESVRAVQDGIATFREVSVTGRADFYARKFQDVRMDNSVASADLRYIAQLPRYVLEVATVLGAMLLVGVLVLTQSSQEAVASLALFLTASSRVMPSMLRLNSARISLDGMAPKAQMAFDLDEFISTHARKRPPIPLPRARMQDKSTAPGVSLEVHNLYVKYPEMGDHALVDVSFSLPAGASLALVGPSGAGKTTLADSILGVVEPGAGSIRLDGRPVADVISSQPGSIAYVPQDVALVSGTVRQNVALGLDQEEVDDERVWDALHRASLDDFLRTARDGLDTAIGDRGVRLSGGQRQRLGIARALYWNPRLVVLDEATSALDAQTEHAVTQMLRRIGEQVTTVTVAHRLATVREASLVLYLDSGRVLAQGSFEEVRAMVPEFDEQARLLGL